MASNKHVALDRKELILRIVFGLATVSIAGVLSQIMISPAEFAEARALIFEFDPSKMLILVLYGIFAFWVAGHLDVIGDQLIGGRIGRVGALELGLTGRAFGPCGAWTRMLRWRIWRSLQNRCKPSYLRSMLKASRAAYVFGLSLSFFAIILVFPELAVRLTGFDPNFVRLFSVVLILGTLMVSNQNNPRRLSIRCTALAVVMITNLVAALGFYVLIREYVDLSFGVVAVGMVVAQGIGWAMRVPFMLAILEVVFLSLCPVDDKAALLAGCVLFHVFFQGPALIAAFWIAFSDAARDKLFGVGHCVQANFNARTDPARI